MSSATVDQMRRAWRAMNGVTVAQAETLSELRQALEEQVKAAPVRRECYDAAWFLLSLRRAGMTLHRVSE